MSINFLFYSIGQIKYEHKQIAAVTIILPMVLVKYNLIAFFYLQIINILLWDGKLDKTNAGRLYKYRLSAF